MSILNIIPTVFAQENVDVMMNNGIEVSDKAAMWMGGGFLAILALAAIVGLLCTIFWIWMLIHSITKPIENKAIWILVLLITGIIGAIVYYFAVKRPFDQKAMGMNPAQTPAATMPPQNPPTFPTA